MTSIKSKIIFSFVISVMATFGIIGMNFLNMKDLALMQDVGAKRAQEAVDAKEASMGGLALYQVIVDAIFDYKPDKTEKKWAEKKAEVLKYLDLVSKTVSTKKEQECLDEVTVAIHEVANLFEQKILPALKSGTGGADKIKELHEKLVVQTDKVEAGMDKLVVSLQGKMKAADVEFDNDIRRTIILSLIIGFSGILLQVWLGTWLLRKEMDKRLEELVESKDRVNKLEGIIPICMYCKKIRDDQKSWHQLEAYISEHSEAKFSHGMCPDCVEEQMKVIANMN